MKLKWRILDLGIMNGIIMENPRYRIINGIIMENPRYRNREWNYNGES